MDLLFPWSCDLALTTVARPFWMSLKKKKFDPIKFVFQPKLRGWRCNWRKTHTFIHQVVPDVGDITGGALCMTCFTCWDLTGLHYLMTLGLEGAPKELFMLDEQEKPRGVSACFSEPWEHQIKLPGRMYEVLWVDAKGLFASVKIQLWIWIQKSLLTLRGWGGQAGFMFNRC